MVQHLHHLSPRADRRAGRARRQGRSKSTRPRSTTSRPAAPRPRPGCGRPNPMPASLTRKGEKDRGASTSSTASTSSRSAACPIAVLRKEIEAGKPVSRLVDGPVDGASEVLLDLGAALNRSGGEVFVRLYLQLARALEPEQRRGAAAARLGGRAAEQCRRGDRALRAHPGGFADQAGRRAAARPEPCRSRPPRRGDRAAHQAARPGSRRHARLSGARRRLCLQGGFPQRRRRLRQGGRAADDPLRRRLEHLLPARHRL